VAQLRLTLHFLAKHQKQEGQTNLRPVPQHSDFLATLGPALHKKSFLGSVFMGKIDLWHWFSLMRTFLPFEIITYAI
jgi:hypothetical protein